MLSRKITGGRPWLVMIAAGAALIAGSGVAAATVQNQTLSLGNKTSGCVRFYVDGVHDLAPLHEYGTVRFEFGKPYMASVFSGKCGGAALRNVWVTPRHQGGSVIYWDVN